MKYKHIALLSAFFILFTMAACHKNDDGPVGGKGGNATLRVNTFHHDKRIDSITVFIKYNTLDAPGNSIYDDSARVVKAPTDTVAVFSGLKTGNYYLYGYGWDPRINSIVKGGLPYVITSETSQIITLPVSED